MLLLPPLEAEKAAVRLSDIIQSDKFASELDQNVGDPLPDESEDQYVLRAKTYVRQFLTKYLDEGTA